MSGPQQSTQQPPQAPPPGYYPPMPGPQHQQEPPAASSEKHAESQEQIQPAKGPLAWSDAEAQTDNPHPIRVGTIIPATLLNQLDGEFTGPVICQTSQDVYDDQGTTLRIPAGSKVLGEAHPVSSGNQRRMAVSFHKLLIKGQPDISLDKLSGLDQTGASALAGKVNNHFLQTFGMAMAVGGIAGLAQIGNNGAVYSPWYGFREGVSQQTALSSEQILNRYLNRYPTVTIRPGTRVKIILLSDL